MLLSGDEQHLSKPCGPEDIRFAGDVKLFLQTSGMIPEKQLRPPSFGERFSFARWWQELVKGAESDAEFGRAIGRSSTVVGDYRRAEQTPNSGILSDAAERMGVDHRWLTGKLPAPPVGWADRELFAELFARWLVTSRVAAAREEQGGELDPAGDPSEEVVVFGPHEVVAVQPATDRARARLERERAKAKQPAAPKRRRGGEPR